MTHSQLSSYESKERWKDPAVTDVSQNGPVRNIFTLAFLKSQDLIFEDVNTNQADLYCAVVILLPINKDNKNITINNYALIEQNLVINLVLNGKKPTNNEEDYFDYEITDKKKLKEQSKGLGFKSKK